VGVGIGGRMVRDASVLRLMQVSRRQPPQGCDGLHGWKRALARIVERSHLDCRKPLAPLSSFHPWHRLSAAPGAGRPPQRAPVRIVERSHPDCKKPLRRFLRFQADGDRCVVFACRCRGGGLKGVTGSRSASDCQKSRCAAFFVAPLAPTLCSTHCRSSPTASRGEDH
jgi:hypothetical protein